MITDCALPNPRAPSYFGAAWAVFCHARKLARFKPNIPMEPARSSSRRVGPSQVWHRRPGITSMTTFLSVQSVVIEKRLTVDESPEQILRARRAPAARLQIFQAFF